MPTCHPLRLFLSFLFKEDTPEDEQFDAAAVAVAGDDSVVLAGSNLDDDFAMVKLDTNGTLSWRWQVSFV